MVKNTNCSLLSFLTWRNNIALSFKAFANFILFFLLLFSVNVLAQTSFNCPNANRCTSKDLEVVGAFLTADLCTQQDGNTEIYNQTQQAPSSVTSSTTLIFTGLTPGKGFSVNGEDRSSTPFCTGTAATCSDLATTIATKLNSTVNRTLIESVTLQEPLTKVTAAPNPFNDKIKFFLKSAVSGRGTLELYNMMGQKLKTVFQGYVEAGRVQSIEYNVPNSQRSNLIYIFRVGEQRTTGKLIGLK